MLMRWVSCSARFWKKSTSLILTSTVLNTKFPMYFSFCLMLLIISEKLFFWEFVYCKTPTSIVPSSKEDQWLSIKTFAISKWFLHSAERKLFFSVTVNKTRCLYKQKNASLHLLNWCRGSQELAQIYKRCSRMWPWPLTIWLQNTQLPIYPT